MALLTKVQGRVVVLLLVDRLRVSWRDFREGSELTDFVWVLIFGFHLVAFTVILVLWAWQLFLGRT